MIKPTVQVILIFTGVHIAVCACVIGVYLAVLHSFQLIYNHLFRTAYGLGWSSCLEACRRKFAPVVEDFNNIADRCGVPRIDVKELGEDTSDEESDDIQEG